MKKVALILGLLFASGCSGNDILNALRDFGKGAEAAYQPTSRPAQPDIKVFYPNQQQNNSTYWQEQNARQQYYQNMYR